ncbi:hypothetical protein ACU4GI_46290 (plasmid) [Cupriavidus basilensis]
MILALAIGLAKYEAPGPPGTATAAKLAAVAYVRDTSAHDPVEVGEAPEIAGNKALVRTMDGRNKGCTVGLARDESDAIYGWAVRSIWCFTRT